MNKIPTNLVTNLYLFLCFPVVKQEQESKYFERRRPGGNQNHFCFLFIASRTLLQGHVKFKTFFEGIFLHIISVTFIIT